MKNQGCVSSVSNELLLVGSAVGLMLMVICNVCVSLSPMLLLWWFLTVSLIWKQ